MRTQFIALTCLMVLAAPASWAQGASGRQATPAPAAGRNVDAKDHSAVIAYLVSQKSPVLPAASKTAISQDFNGAPLAGKPAVHKVNADKVYCRARNQQPEGANANCTVTYAPGKTATITGEDARKLYITFGKAGVQDDGAAGSIERVVTKLACTVDDKVAQGKPGNGDVIPGFACSFTTDP